MRHPICSLSVPMKSLVANLNRFFNPKFFSVVLCLFLTSACFADDGPWFSKFFVQGSWNRYFAPDMAADYIMDDGGFRVGVGYSFDLPYNLSVPVYVESGYSHLVGTNPILLDVKSVPLIFFGGVDWTFMDFFKFNFSVGMGAMFSTVEHYESAYDMVKGNLTVSDGSDFLFAFRAGLGFDLVEGFATVYATYGLDLILETDGPIPLPGLNVGLRLNQIRFSEAKDFLTSLRGKKNEK